MSIRKSDSAISTGQGYRDEDRREDNHQEDNFQEGDSQELRNIRPTAPEAEKRM